MQPAASTLLHRLEKLRDTFSAESASAKLPLLEQLARRRLTSARQVHRLHELLSFLHAYPDDRKVHAQVERMLGAFAQRSDLRKFADDLADTGTGFRRNQRQRPWFRGKGRQKSAR